MSTGLTYVFVGDNVELAPYNGGTYIFNDYSEAYAHGQWLVNTYNNGDFLYFIWTAGPNQNGYWFKTGSVTSFTPVD